MFCNDLGSAMKLKKQEFLESEFRKTLRAASRSKKPSSSYIANLYPWHCRESMLALSNFAFVQVKGTMRNAGPVRILAHTFHDYFFHEDVVGNFVNFLNFAGDLRILLARRPIEGKGKGLQILVNRSAEFTKNSERPGLEIRTSSIIDRAFPQFIVVADSAYRIEAKHEPIYDPTKFTAKQPELLGRVCFDDVSGAQQLVRSFDLLWQAADENTAVINVLRDAVSVG